MFTISCLLKWIDYFHKSIHTTINEFGSENAQIINIINRTGENSNGVGKNSPG